MIRIEGDHRAIRGFGLIDLTVQPLQHAEIVERVLMGRIERNRSTERLHRCLELAVRLQDDAEIAVPVWLFRHALEAAPNEIQRLIVAATLVREYAVIMERVWMIGLELQHRVANRVGVAEAALLHLRHGDLDRLLDRDLDPLAATACRRPRSRRPRLPLRRYSCEPVVEVTVGDCELDPVQGLSAHRARQELAADFREHGVGENRVDHATATLDLGAAADDELDGFLVIRERNLVVLGDPLRDPIELQANDIGNVVAQRVRNDGRGGRGRPKRSAAARGAWQCPTSVSTRSGLST
jgi:hypothetical protein